MSARELAPLAPTAKKIRGCVDTTRGFAQLNTTFPLAAIASPSVGASDLDLSANARTLTAPATRCRGRSVCTACVSRLDAGADALTSTEETGWRSHAVACFAAATLLLVTIAMPGFFASETHRLRSASFNVAASAYAEIGWFGERPLKSPAPTDAVAAAMMATTAICTMVHNEEGAISEWLAYHHGVLGIPRFILYADRCTDETRAAVRSFEERGCIVEWVEWNKTSAQWTYDALVAGGPGSAFNKIKWDEQHELPRSIDDFFNPSRMKFYKQYLANRDCLRRLAGDTPPGATQELSVTRWAALIDVDEFIVGRRGRGDVAARLVDAAANPHVGCEWMNHVMFGASGLLTRPQDELVTATMRQRARVHGGNGKSWVQLSSLAALDEIQRHWYATGPGRDLLFVCFHLFSLFLLLFVALTPRDSSYSFCLPPPAYSIIQVRHRDP